MKQEEQREKVIQDVADMLRRNPFSVEFRVKKRPQGIRVIYELPQEQMDEMVYMAATKHKEG